MKVLLKKFINAMKKLPTALIGCLFFIAVCALTLGVISTNTSLSVSASSLTARFSGEYKIEDGDWKEIPKDGHIPASQGDVTLKGNFIVSLPNGDFYTDNPKGFCFDFLCHHVSVKIRVGEQTAVFDAEHPQIGVDACGVIWSAYRFPESQDGLTEITISNPHALGNDLAVDKFLDNIQMGEPTMMGDILAEKYDASRYVGFAFVAISLVVFVLSAVAYFAKLKIARTLWIIGFWILFTGGFYILDVLDIFFRTRNTPFNTTALCLSQILSSFFLSLFATSCLSGKNKKIATITQIVVGVVTVALTILSACDVVRIFDVCFYWYILYAIQAIVLCVFSVREMRTCGKGIRWVLLGTLISIACILVDFFGVSFALWPGLYLTKVVFAGMLVIVIAFGINAIISNYKMSIRTKEMEAELKDKSIAVMISQIQPHFLYNSLNSIAELCVVDPKRAEKATIDFSRYLRGNMGALNENKAIEFEDELNHLRHYIELEKLRYGDDLQFEYDIRESAFTLPALTVQPLVENAVNHGIRYHKMKGKVKISSFSDEENYYVTIEDDGVGFNPEEAIDDGRKHVGIANVKYRLDVICGGSVEIDSKKGVGTLVTIKIPKEK